MEQPTSPLEPPSLTSKSTPVLGAESEFAKESEGHLGNATGWFCQAAVPHNLKGACFFGAAFSFRFSLWAFHCATYCVASGKKSQNLVL
jgi:hypothetical protein